MIYEEKLLMIIVFLAWIIRWKVMEEGDKDTEVVDAEIQKSIQKVCKEFPPAL